MSIILIKRIINIIRDIIFTYLYVKPIDSKEINKKNEIISLIFLFAPIAMYTAEDGGIFSYAIIRVVYRYLCLYFYIILSKRSSRISARYDAILMTSTITIIHNIFLTPVTRPILLGNYMFVEATLLNEVISLFIVNIVAVILYDIVYHYMPLNKIKRIENKQIIIYIIISIISIYTNSVLRYITDTQNNQSYEFSIFAILLQLALLLCIIFIEQVQYQAQQTSEMKLQAISSKAQLEQAKLQKDNNDLLNSIRHDIKNHLIAINYLITKENNQEAIEYIEQLTGYYLKQQINIDTGNQILDGLLIEKLIKAESLHITTSCIADFSKLDIDDIDLCTIFSNLLDNAIEECIKIEDIHNRYINIKGGIHKEQFIYAIENSIHQDMTIRSTLPVTTKDDQQNHGIGLKNVNKAIEKYQGILHLKTDNQSHQFTAIIIIPINDRL